MVAAKKRARSHLMATYEYVASYSVKKLTADMTLSQQPTKKCHLLVWMWFMLLTLLTLRLMANMCFPSRLSLCFVSFFNSWFDVLIVDQRIKWILVWNEFYISWRLNIPSRLLICITCSPYGLENLSRLLN